jgi:predicted NAD/FAD-dependent oxidoreductase
MSSLGKSLAAKSGVAIERQARVAGVETDHGTWRLRGDQGQLWRAKQLIMTAPPIQAAALLGSSAGMLGEVMRSKNCQPCLAVAVRLPRRNLGWYGIQSDDPIVAWIANDTSKRPELHEGWTVIMVHASAEFSAAHYETAEEVVVPDILQAASKISGLELSSGDYFFHRWRYALPGDAVESDGAVLVEGPAPLVLAGDAWAGGKIEGAWRSGLVAATILSKS